MLSPARIRKLALSDFQIENYRSVKKVWLKLQRMNVIVGPNGVGKSNLYRAMFLLASTASGRFAHNLAQEGSIQSALWSGRMGKVEKKERDIRLSIKIDDLQYDLHCGRVALSEQDSEATLFGLDPEIKKEEVTLLKNSKQTLMLKRAGAAIQIRDASGEFIDYSTRVPRNESVLTGLRDPYRFPRLAALRQELLSWRFYHHFRTDNESPLRKPQLAVSTDVMAEDGSDFVAALATIYEVGDRSGLVSSLNDAFPGARLDFQPYNQRLKLRLRMPEFSRPFEAFELSDGTLQYLCLLTAIYSLRAPTLLAINEPETSIHPSLFEPLARLLVQASEHSQIWITTHSRELADHILELGGYSSLELKKVEGQTKLVHDGLGGYKHDDDDDSVE